MKGLATLAVVLSLSCLAILPARSQATPPDWLPAAIVLPADWEVYQDLAIGTRTRLLQFATGEDVDLLLEDWRAALIEAGYEVNPAPELLEYRQLLYAGQGFEIAQISVVGEVEEGTLLQFDATLAEE